MLSTALKRRRAAILAGTLLPLLTAAPATAFSGDWNPLPGLNAAAGGDWIRDYETGPLPSTVYAATEG
ncbi:MAG TPA: hypothetical protein VLK58_27150, partial [Conexibacter sp.]|nr:hypothetical protein [Conexibacter sp.]